MYVRISRFENADNNWDDRITDADARSLRRMLLARSSARASNSDPAEQVPDGSPRSPPILDSTPDTDLLGQKAVPRLQ